MEFPAQNGVASRGLFIPCSRPGSCWRPEWTMWRKSLDGKRFRR